MALTITSGADEMHRAGCRRSISDQASASGPELRQGLLRLPACPAAALTAQPWLHHRRRGRCGPIGSPVRQAFKLRAALTPSTAAGASGSGKTTFTSRLKKMLANIVVISLDMYNDGDKVLENNFDDPRIVDYTTLMQNLADLRAGRPTKVPIYDFKQSKRVGYEDVGVPESRIIVIEGIHALSDTLESMLDLKIAITGGVHFDLVKRVRPPSLPCSPRHLFPALVSPPRVHGPALQCTTLFFHTQPCSSIHHPGVPCTTVSELPRPCETCRRRCRFALIGYLLFCRKRAQRAGDARYPAIGAGSRRGHPAGV